MAGVNPPLSSAAPRKPFSMGWQQKTALLALLAYCIFALSTMGVNSERLANGWSAAAKFLGMMFPPQMGKMDELWQGLKETMQIAVLATAIGILLSLPVGLMSASNMSPAPLRAFGRGLTLLFAPRWRNRRTGKGRTDPQSA